MRLVGAVTTVLALTGVVAPAPSLVIHSAPRVNSSDIARAECSDGSVARIDVARAFPTSVVYRTRILRTDPRSRWRLSVEFASTPTSTGPLVVGDFSASRHGRVRAYLQIPRADPSVVQLRARSYDTGATCSWSAFD